MGKNNKCIHIRFNLDDKMEGDVWQWLHSAAEGEHKSMNGFVLQVLSRQMSVSDNGFALQKTVIALQDSVQSILSDSLVDRLSDRIIEKLSAKMNLTDLRMSVNPSSSSENGGSSTDDEDPVSGESLESSIPEEALDFMGGY